MKLLLTEDGSHTMYSAQFGEAYHSSRGALTESSHIFISSGLSAVTGKEINVFEVGFGTGLNAFLSWIHAEVNQLQINYTSIELYPVALDLLSDINYSALFPGHETKFAALHKTPWDQPEKLSSHFTLHKLHQSVFDTALPSFSQNIIFFDAFSPEKQPELWSADVFRKMYDLLTIGGILVTYCSKGYVRRNMKEAGFTVEKLPGPLGKHEIVRAFKRQ